MQSQTRGRRARNQDGSSIVLVLLFLLVLSAAGMGMMFSSNIDTLVGSNYKQSMGAYYASKAGLEEARDRLRLGAAGAANGITPPTVMPQAGVAGGAIYILNPDNTGGDTPWTANTKYFDDELCHEQFVDAAGNNLLGLQATAKNVPCQGAVNGVYYTTFASLDPNTGTAAAVPYKWVRVTLKQSGTSNPWCTDGNCASNSTQVCADGNLNETLLPAAKANCEAANMEPVYTITSLAMTSTGARRLTQQEVSNVTMPPLPGSLVLDGPGATLSTAHSGQYGINGNNANSCNKNPPAGNLPAIGTISNNDATNVGNSLFRPANYTGVDGVTPDVSNVSNTLGSLATVGGLETLVTNLINVADYVGSGAGVTSWGTAANPVIDVIQGDYSGMCGDPNSGVGYGILVVTGALTCSGNYAWTGVVLVIGKGNADLQGGGNGSITGGVLVANLYDHLCGAGDNSCNNLHLLPPTSQPGSPNVQWSGGGGNHLQYDQCELGIANQKLGYRILVTREEMY